MADDDQDDHGTALAKAGGLGRPARDHDDQAGGVPGSELRGSPMAGTAARDEPAGSPADPAASSGAPGGAQDSQKAQESQESQDGQGPRKKRKTRSFWRELPLLIVIALAIALLIKSFVVQAFWIPSSSMENTLDINDKILVNKLVYHFRSIQPGDIVVFNGEGSWDPVPAPAKASSDPLVRLYDATLDPLFHSILGLFGTAAGQTDYVKRVIGVPGDHVACCNPSGDVTVNGVPLHEQSYLYPGNPPSMNHFSITVPPGRLWVMGDHRSVSWDSRGHRSDPGNGTFPENTVIGRAFLIDWPPSRWQVLGIPATFGQPGIAAAHGAAWMGTTTAPAASYLPLEGGFLVAVPLTWLQRRLRRRWLPHGWLPRGWRHGWLGRLRRR